MIDERVNACDSRTARAGAPTATSSWCSCGSPTIRRRDGKRIADVALPRGSVIVAVDRGGGDVLVPNGDTTLQRGDDVIAMIKRDTRLDVCAALVG